MKINDYMEGIRSQFTLRYLNDTWCIFKGTVMFDTFLNGTEALKALRELQNAEIKTP